MRWFLSHREEPSLLVPNVWVSGSYLVGVSVFVGYSFRYRSNGVDT